MAAGIEIPQLHSTAPTSSSLQHMRLDRLVNMAVEHVREQVHARQQHLHVEAMAAPVAVYGQRDALVEVLARLLSAASTSAGAGGLVTLSVTQIGLNATLKVNAYQSSNAALPGAQQSDAASDWPIMERLLEPHGGAVSARSNTEGGTEYTLLLPVMPEEAMPVTRRAPLIAGPGAPACRVLVVDDSPDAADSMACLLSIRGHEVRVAYDGLTAYAKVLEWKPDVVLLDIQLPGMDGNEIAESVRARATPAPTFIALSGYGQGARESLFDLYLTKPVDPSVLMQSVERYACKPAEARI